jgi:dienelactone hydrolase
MLNGFLPPPLYVISRDQGIYDLFAIRQYGDRTWVGVAGASLGGTLTFATAAQDDVRI